MIPDVVIVGPLLIDEFTYINPKNPPLHPGGSALYAALGASLLNVKIGLTARIGEDYPKEILDNLAARQIDLSGLKIIGSHTCRCTINMNDSGVRHYSYSNLYPSFEEVCLSPTDIPDKFMSAKAFHISPFIYTYQMNILKTIREKSGAIISLDPVDVVPEANRRQYLEAAQLANYFLPSMEEYLLFENQNDLEQGIKNLANNSMSAVILKRGAHGTLAYDVQQDHVIQEKSLLQKVIDTNGAGDTFCGAFLAAISLGHRLDKAIKMAAVAASFTLQGQGPLHLLTVTSQQYYQAFYTAYGSE